MASPLGRSGGGAWPLPALNWEGCWLCRRVLFEASLASSTGAGYSPHSPLSLHLQGKSLMRSQGAAELGAGSTVQPCGKHCSFPLRGAERGHCLSQSRSAPVVLLARRLRDNSSSPVPPEHSQKQHHDRLSLSPCPWCPQCATLGKAQQSRNMTAVLGIGSGASLMGHIEFGSHW